MIEQYKVNDWRLWIVPIVLLLILGGLKFWGHYRRTIQLGGAEIRLPEAYFAGTKPDRGTVVFLRNSSDASESRISAVEIVSRVNVARYQNEAKACGQEVPSEVLTAGSVCWILGPTPTGEVKIGIDHPGCDLEVVFTGYLDRLRSFSGVLGLIGEACKEQNGT